MPCLVRRSLLTADDMITRRTCDGALKCRLRDLRDEDDTNGLRFILLFSVERDERDDVR